MSGVLYADTLCGICLAKFVTCEETLMPPETHMGERWEEHWRIICIQVILPRLHYKMCDLQPNLKKIPLSHPSKLI